MNNDNQNNREGNIGLIPSNVIANMAHFNMQFYNKVYNEENPDIINIAKMLTVMGQQENTIGILYNIMGQNYSDKQLHDMHNEIFGGLKGGDISEKDVKDIDFKDIIDKLTACLHQQNQQIKELSDKIRQKVQAH
ncbi:MAG TPA: hypothetical protein VFG45_08615 [Candidatus Nitrosocosmicus sp.]|nr:hypothetical protein [Candidatus Nitrosocosmicus sp.]